MAVPPGNKQIGQVMLAVTYAAPSLTVDTTLHNFSTTAIVTDPARVTTVQPPKNLQIGTVNMQVVHGVEADTTVVQLNNLTLVAVLRYAPPTSATVENFVVTSVVVDQAQASRPLSARQNLLVGGVGLTALVGVSASFVYAALHQFVVVAVVRKFDPRHEHITMTIEYAESAKLNTGALV